MAFKHLEDRLPEEEVDKFLNVFDKLSEPTKTTLGFALDIAALLSANGLGEKYGLFGGYAVLAQLVSVYSEPVMLSWRGSSDIDMNGNEEVLNSIKGAYPIISDRPSQNIEDKRTVKIRNENGEIKIDYVVNSNQNCLQTERHKIFGIPVRVTNPVELIKSKVMLAKEQRPHLEDVVSLLGVLDSRRVLPQDIIPLLDTEVKHELYDVLLIYERSFDKSRLSVGPSKEFTAELKRELKRYK